MHESGSAFCTTDAHKAFDQVFREGTTYLLYGHGVRGKMLKMLTTWINTNISTQLWRGHCHIGDEIKLDDNGIRQGCNLSPILYLIIINTLVSEEPSWEMPEWDKEFRGEAYKQGVQLIKEEMIGQWAVNVAERVKIWTFPSEGFSRIPRVSIGFPLGFHWKSNPAHFCHPFLRKKHKRKVWTKSEN